MVVLRAAMVARKVVADRTHLEEQEVAEAAGWGAETAALEV